MTLWNKTDLINALHNILITKADIIDNDIAINGISIDSRTVKLGDLFIAINGQNVDGHDYIDAALNAGAGAILISNPEKIINNNNKIILVSDTISALNHLAKYRRQQLNNTCHFIGITGSVGKTTTKELLKIMLSPDVYATKGNYNNHLGVPLTLASLPLNTKYAVIEMGMNHLGELTVLSELAQPNTALITTIAPSHIGNFNNLSEIAIAKSEIFSGLTKNGIALFGTNHDFIDVLQKYAAQSNAAAIIPIPLSQVINNGVITINQNSYNLSNYHDDPALLSCITCALWVIYALKLDVQIAIEQLQHFSRPQGRGDIITIKNNIRIINDSYNASTASMQAALIRLHKLKNTNGRKIAVLGDMLEMGDFSRSYHLSLLDHMVNTDINIVHTVGTAMKDLHNALPIAQRGNHADNVDELIKIWPHIIQNNDLILIKGSAGMRLSKIIIDIG